MSKIAIDGESYTTSTPTRAAPARAQLISYRHPYPRDHPRSAGAGATVNEEGVDG